MAAKGVERLHKQLSQIEQEILALRAHSTDNAAMAKEDIMSFSKFFYTSAELATQYLREQLITIPGELIQKQQAVVEKLKLLVQDPQSKSFVEVEDSINDLMREVKIKAVEKKSYKVGPKAKQSFEELRGIFERFTKEMFRKFKKFIQTSEEFDAEGITDLDTNKERLKDLFAKLGVTTDRLASQRLQPAQLPSLPAFPKLTTPTFLQVQAKYGNFKIGKDVTHPTFQLVTAFGPVELDDGSVYEGQWLQNQRHGLGKSLFINGDFYEGYWLEDRPDIIGRMVTSEGDVYEGYLQRGKANGKGVFVKLNGYRYIGQWYNDMKHGFGDETTTSGLNYKGNLTSPKDRSFLENIKAKAR